MIRERLAFDHGVHLRGTPLWLDAERRQKNCIITGVYGSLPAKHERGLVSAKLAEHLTRAGYLGKVLPSPYGRWAGLGGQQVQLVDVGGPLGESGALVLAGDQRILYGGVLPEREVGWPQAELLVAVAPALGWRGVNLAQLVDTLVAQLESGSAIQVDDVGAACAMIAALRERGVALRPLGLLGKLVGTGQGVSVSLSGGAVAQKARLIFVETGLGERPKRAPDVTLRFQYAATHATLVNAVRQCGAKELVLVGGESPDVTSGTVSSSSVKIPGCEVSVARWGRARQLLLA